MRKLGFVFLALVLMMCVLTFIDPNNISLGWRIFILGLAVVVGVVSLVVMIAEVRR
jgi:hypothetical protein